MPDFKALFQNWFVGKEFSTLYDAFVAGHNAATATKKGKQKRSGPLHSFEDSPYFDLHEFKKAIETFRPPCNDANKYTLRFYYDAALNYSESHGKKYADWKATVRTWMYRDVDEGKFIVNRPSPSLFKQTGSFIQPTKPDYLNR